MESLPQPPIPPRPITSKARRRSWNEPVVRVLWLSALAVAIVASWQLVEQLAETRATLYRIAHWTRINEAKIRQIGDSSRESYRVTVEELASKPVKITYVDEKGVTHELAGRLTAQRKAV